jgi:nucleoside-diphosphate-sugar epimerase
MERNLEYFSGKRILITGGGGYLGSKLATYIAPTSATIYLLDINFNSISTILINNRYNVFRLEVDLKNSQQTAEACRLANPDLIFHFAAALDRERDFSLFNKLFEINVGGTHNLLEGISTVTYSGFYFASTSEVYGTKNSSPFKEDQITNPPSPYSLTKVMAEKLISTFSETYNRPFSIFRFFNFYGDDMPENFFVSQLMASLKSNCIFNMTKGEQQRDYLEINELLYYIAHIVQNPKCIGQIVNICSGKGTPLKDLAFKIAGKYNKESLINLGSIPYRKNEIWNMIGDNSKLLNLLTNEE